MSDGYASRRQPLLVRGLTALGRVVGYVICEPQLRLGRRRHDNVCDRCDRDCGRYSMEGLDFPTDDDFDPADSSTLETLRVMANAEYTRVCLECSVEMERDHDE